MESDTKRDSVELLKRGYSDEEVANIYELGRFHLENGGLRQAEVVMSGLKEVAPDFAPAWLAWSYICIQNRDYDGATQAARQALKLDPQFNEAILFLIACLLTIGDYNAAGTYLGEMGDKIENGAIDNPNLIRFYKGQLARYQSR